MAHHGNQPATLLPATPRLDRLLPTVATSPGVPGLTRGTDRAPGPARRTVVVLVDGLGAQLLARRSGHAPFLRSLLQDPEAAATIDCGFPSTTATSMGSFGTGSLAGSHGLVGYEAYDPRYGHRLQRAVPGRTVPRRGCGSRPPPSSRRQGSTAWRSPGSVPASSTAPA
uniref:Alkaline phosphatase family protein n=1 Tax=Janibacter limosus TaxID=53458 RepID=A0AC61U880_9MICO|nr:alkaline phosphatase family protein [Janibacter limosus]